MERYFVHDERLGIRVPCLNECFENYDLETQQEILYHWETIRGQIPDRIIELEEEINKLQMQLDEEPDFEVCCKLNKDIAELASIINDLWLWYRTDGEVSRTHLFH